jgi:2,3-bisphosphoglycerate-dependent phosphoglycerate mutase
MEKIVLVLLRHGESIWNVEERFAGSSDVPLSDNGMSQAIEAGTMLKDYNFDLVYTSTLQRAVHTLSLMKPGMGNFKFEHRQSAAIDERNFGWLEGQRKADLERSHGIDQVERWRFDWNEPMPDNLGERFAQMALRVVDFYESSIATEIKAGKKVLVVAHGQVLRAIAMHIAHAEPWQSANYYIPNAKPLRYGLHSSGQLSVCPYTLVAEPESSLSKRTRD